MKKGTIRYTLSTEALLGARIPRNHWRLGADTFPGTAHSLAAVQQYLHHVRTAHQRGLGLVFEGNQSSGKTFLIGYVLRCLLTKGYDCFYVTLRELTDAMLGKDEAFEFNILERLRQADFVAIDQIGREPNDGVINCLREAIKMRTSQMLPTLYGLDLPVSRTAPTNFAGEYGAPIYNYLVDFGELVTCRISSRRAEQMREARFAGVL